MPLRIDRLLVLLAASAALAGSPGEGRAQPATAGESDVPERDGSSSHGLEARARKLAERGREGWARAASLYARAAELRGPGDLAAAEDLLLAGHLYYYVRDHQAAVRAFRAAGQLLVALGRLETAAVAFRDGAWVADLAGLEAEARELCQWSEVLTRPQPEGRQGRRRFATGATRRS